jgi:formylglycine-generating enzyme required for sulfatase activity
MMGSADSDKDAENDEKPQHKVLISTFYISKTEVTQAQYQAVMGNNPSHFSPTGEGKEQVAGQPTDRYPVENVSWLDAIRFCNALSKKERLAPYYEVEGESVRVSDLKGLGYRLPTEAEWEFTCRAGTTTGYFFGDGPSELGGYAWYDGNSGQMTHPVAQNGPNVLGLYDTCGNVWEWCWDGYASYQEGFGADPSRLSRSRLRVRSPGSQRSPVVDPQGPTEATNRVIRGGSWADPPRDCRSASRAGYVPGYRLYDLGFRVARNLPAGNKDESASTQPAPSTPSESTATAPSAKLKSGSKMVKVQGRPERPPMAWTSPSTGMTFVRIKGGESMMGSRDDDKEAQHSEKPRHNVRISPFLLGVTEVTQRQYWTVMGNNPSCFSSTGVGKEQVAGQPTDRHPVENVSWLEAIRFATP